MSDILQRILAVKADEIVAAKTRKPLATVRAEAEAADRDERREGIVVPRDKGLCGEKNRGCDGQEKSSRL